MSGITSVRAALEVALDAMSPALTTAWENVPYTPVPGTDYQRAHLMVATPDNPVFGPGYRELGILQLDLMYTQGAGAGAAEARAEVIRTTFARGNTFVNGGVSVVVEKTPEIGVGAPDGDRWKLPVRIRWYANQFS